ncbi:PE-PPE domain-containing protein [Mycolicibacterium grossiae]|uniref:PE-PPE domain-containing protein n=2 Tax=Mycolicibacterium grossiae TaxID=1552759 RepID=UPI0014792A96|nr:PE-PPE domain-containing protein [Mycolicibacterium grossiae]
MAEGRRWLAAVVVAAILAVAAPGVAATAQTRIALNGGRPAQWPILSDVLAGQGLTQQGWLDFASLVGSNWLPGTTARPLDYPAQLGLVSGPFAMTTDQSTAIGRKLLHDAILDEMTKGEPIVVTGLSQGTLVIESELAHLLTAADAPAAKDVTFYLFGGMVRGLGDMYLRGVTIPIFGQTFIPVPESQYDVVVVNEQWDGWANPPDRPWNALAVVNAVMGAFYTVNGSNDHGRTALDGMDDATLVSQVTNSRGGTTTTYLVPRQELPITRPLRQLGFPGWVVDRIDELLRPWIAAGYSSMTPYLGPRIERGQLVWTPPVPPVLPVASAVPKPVTPPVQQAALASGAESVSGVPAAAARRADVEPPVPAAVESPVVDTYDDAASAKPAVESTVEDSVEEVTEPTEEKETPSEAKDEDEPRSPSTRPGTTGGSAGSSTMVAKPQPTTTSGGSVSGASTGAGEPEKDADAVAKDAGGEDTVAKDTAAGKDAGESDSSSDGE